MENGRLLSYLYNEKLSKDSYMDILEFIYNYRIYRYGSHNKIDNDRKISILKEKLKDWLREMYCFEKIFMKSQTKFASSGTILSSAYFDANNHLKHLGFNPVDGPWKVNGSSNFIKDIRYVHDYYSFLRTINSIPFQDLISTIGENLVSGIVEKTRDLLRKNDIKAVIANSTHTFSNRLPLKAAQLEKLPTFVFLHGLPFPFYYEEPSRTDYLVVWSEKIKENFVEITKFPANRIFVSGHPFYQKLCINKLRFSLDNILIIGPSCEAERMNDRGNMISFLLEVKDVLTKFGVKEVRFRPHPHEDVFWYLKFIDKSFFKPDLRPISQALEDSTLVMGTISTVILEALYYGVNYLLYDPLDSNGINIYGHKPVPPFDGNDRYLPIARTKEDIEVMIKSKELVNIELFNEYIQTPFDISFIKKMIIS